MAIFALRRGSSPLKSAVFDPLTSLTWVQVWSDRNIPTLSGSPATDGGLLDAWAPHIGGLTLTASGGTRPTWRSSDASFNGKGCIEFDGAATYLYVNTAANNAQPNSLVVVYKLITLQAGNRSIVDNNSGVRNAVYATSTGEFRGYAGALGTSSGFTSDTNIHLVIYDVNGASSRLILDGSAGLIANWGTDSYKGVVVGAGPGPTQLCNCKVAFVGYIDGIMTTQQKSDLRTWAQSYYGTP